MDPMDDDFASRVEHEKAREEKCAATERGGSRMVMIRRPE
jgi:hypothetical protein